MDERSSAFDEMCNGYRLFSPNNEQALERVVSRWVTMAQVYYSIRVGLLKRVVFQVTLQTSKPLALGLKAWEGNSLVGGSSFESSKWASSLDVGNYFLEAGKLKHTSEISASLVWGICQYIECTTTDGETCNFPLKYVFQNRLSLANHSFYICYSLTKTHLLLLQIQRSVLRCMI